MNYISTRGGIAPVSFKEAVMMGLATDGGLLLPESVPQIDQQILVKWQGLSYQELACEIFSLFISDIPTEDIRSLVNKSYSSFNHREVTPVVKHDDVFILELFHGPTLAFKDVALQLLGNIFEYLLKKSGQKMNILGATSGDTGSAAIYGVRGKENINIFILHPYKRVSPIQELQMTSVLDENVYNIAIKGTFDDGQEIVKAVFNDIDFKQKYQLGAINSINWARVLAQVVYYVYAYFKVNNLCQGGVVDFAIPTGNFGDIFAGYIARKMIGADKIGKLILATNENDILSRFVKNGDYSKSEVVQTASPSMDIQMASNFERYLFYLNGEDAIKTKQDMQNFASSGALSFSEKERKIISQDFKTKRVGEDETVETIKSFYKDTNYVLDPHTAVGVNAAKSHRREGVPVVCLATAHPGKFGDVVTKAIGEINLPEELSALQNKKTRCVVLEAEIDQIKSFVETNALV